MTMVRAARGFASSPSSHCSWRSASSTVSDAMGIPVALCLPPETVGRLLSSANTVTSGRGLPNSQRNHFAGIVHRVPPRAA